MNAVDTTRVNQADSDTSSILMSASTPPMTDSPIIITTEAPESGVIATVAVTPTAIESAPVAAFEMTPTPVVDFSPVTTPTPTIETPAPVVDMNPAPVITPILETPTPVATSSASIFDSIMTDSAPASTPAETPEPVVPAPSALSSLWDEPVAAPLPVSVAPVISQSAPREIDATHNFTTPREFLEKSISNIDVMLGNIDARHTAKETEELGYKMEKLRFTELEKTAHTEKIIMDKERDHASSMRKMLEKEIEKDEANKKEVTSVEASMNDIGNKHPVHKAHKTEHVKE